MSWSTTTLSTTTSIARHESNINLLSPVSPSLVTSHNYSVIPGNSIQFAVTDNVAVLLKDNNEYLVFNITLTPFQIYTATLTFKLYNLQVTRTGLEDVITFSFNNANCTTASITDDTGQYTFDCTIDLFNTVTNQINEGWQTKIDLAKLKLGNDLLIQFRSQRIYDLYSPLELITNPTVLILASDYLTLALIYTELAFNGLNLIFERKRNWYWKQYELELHNVGSTIKLLNLRVSNEVGRLQI